MGYATVRVHQGPSVYSRHAVIRFRLEGASGETPPTHLYALTERLIALLPGLGSHYAPCEAARTPIPHLFEHVCIELQNQTGAELRCVRPHGARIADDEAVIPYEDESVGLEAASLALRLIESPPRAFERRLQTFLRFAQRHRLPVQDRAVVRAAEARDIPVIRLAGRVIQLGHGRHQQRLSATETTRTNVVSNEFAANKDYARRVFRSVGLPVPRYERVHGEREAVAAAKRIGFPVVVKPNRGHMGIAVSVGMRNSREVRHAFGRARELGSSVLVEEFVAGSDYRMLVVDGKLAAAAKRVPARVVGDGTHTIEELVNIANLDPRRGAGQRSSWTRLELDEDSDRLLAGLGYDRGAVAREGETVYLRRIANTSAGGTAVDVTDEVHPENREIAERAAIAIGLDIAGVDLLVHDITQPMRAQGGVICEINSRPGLRKHLWPAEGRPRDVIAPILDMLFPHGSRGRIPIAVVTGLGDTGGAARLLADLLAAGGSTVGLAARDGVFIDGRRADGGGMDGPAQTRMLLLDPTVEVAVVEVSPAEAREHGLGYDWADACAVINDGHVESEELVEALRLVVAQARSHVVMSAEDEETYRLQTCPEARVRHVRPDDRAPELYATALALCLGRESGVVEQRLAGVPVAPVSPS